MYAKAAAKQNPLLRSSAYSIVMRDVQNAPVRAHHYGIRIILR